LFSVPLFNLKVQESEGKIKKWKNNSTEFSRQLAWFCCFNFVGMQAEETEALDICLFLPKKHKDWTWFFHLNVWEAV